MLAKLENFRIEPNGFDVPEDARWGADFRMMFRFRLKVWVRVRFGSILVPCY